MAFPEGTPTVQLLGTLPRAAGGRPFTGRVLAAPSQYIKDAQRHALYPNGAEDIPFDAEGRIDIRIVPTDASGISPTGWRWYFSVEPDGAPKQKFWTEITGPGPVYLDELVHLPAPGGGSSGGGGDAALAAHAARTLDVHGIVDTSALETKAGATSKAGAAQSAATSAAASDATAKVAAHTEASDPHGDRAWTAGAFLARANNLSDLISAAAARLALGLGNAATRNVGTTIGTVAAGDDSRFGAGGSTIRTASVRITDGTVSDLPTASSWTIAQTSAGTQLRCSITATAGDRIRALGLFMYDGGRYLDYNMLSGAGALGTYAASGTTTPLAEGNPTLYPSGAFAKYTSAEFFTVGPEHIDGTGKITIALVNQGTTPGKVYAHTLYPWRLRLENIGPEPA
ncbi:hypothetical protein ACGF1Z_31195 [Streptomyces sp. NPDC048018]|uniref:hypothetical protein n=1 Tax=Streptomyces sp. NPDC048018 TaxID=3365499 RepID=UPI003718DA46